MNVKLPKPVSMMLACLLALLPVLASANTLERVRSNNAITLGYVRDFAPFSNQDGDKATGYAIELCLKVVDKIKSELNLPGLQVRYQGLTVADEIGAVSSGKVDILCTPAPETLADRKSVSFSIPIYTAGLSAVVRKDAPEPLLRVLNGQVAHTGPTWRATINQGLANQTFAAIKDGLTEDWIRDKTRMLGVVTTQVTVKDNMEGVNLVAEGKASAFFSERMLLKNVVEKSKHAEDLMVVPRLFEFVPVSMVLERGDEDFRLLVDTVISEMYRSGEIEQAYAKYLGGARGTSKLLFEVYTLP
ncbi:amino acid ABC transporter substrate-binding protein [Metapseudomonas boanensis]|uniref:Amino acid ABC transporter substrate-binding protein n=1 Tax=Metapseudomonas boanensis TaxID=2822138 RepID=A0ABS5XLD7_9GAMM|nr:amino acid ABC transporter substrate-binding protein [Pseudomonas boanensis]MBT8768511.1 amino acid ABC transporter substrate-binding protein [Pseudomonas boanensis]